jgi:SAM-dependent methyltransferase
VRASDPRINETWIVDLDPAAESAAVQAGHRYFCGRIEDFRPEQKFDVIMMLNLIEHVSDPEAVMRKVAGLLTPGGVVIVKTPNYDALDARLFRRRSWTGYHCPRHWVLFTLDSFRGLAERVGLAVRSASYTQGAPFWAGSLLVWLAERGLTRVTRERSVFNHPLFGAIAAAFALFDFVRRPFAKTSQMLFVLGHQDPAAR